MNVNGNGKRFLSFRLENTISPPVFSVRFEPTLPRGIYSLSAELRRAAMEVTQEAGEREIALCFTSMMSAAALSQGFLANDLLEEAGAKPRLYFLSVDGVNLETFRKILAKKNISPAAVNFLSVTREEIYEEISCELLQDFGVSHAAPAALVYLAQHLGPETYLVSAEGGFHRHSEHHTKIAKAYAKPAGVSLAFSTADIFFYLWLEKTRRAGEFHFFSRTPELVAATIQHSQFLVDKNRCDYLRVLAAEFAVLPFHALWDLNAKYEAVWHSEWIEQYLKSATIPYAWQRTLGANVALEKIFREQLNEQF